MPESSLQIRSRELGAPAAEVVGRIGWDVTGLSGPGPANKQLGHPAESEGADHDHAEGKTHHHREVKGQWYGRGYAQLY